MPPNLLITVSSDIGLQLAQIGGVASNIDPTILSSTIPALKSMVTSEISNTDSSFMTGTTDYTRFGTFAIKTNFDINLIVTYLISYDEMDIPSNEFDQFAEDVTLTFGHLLSRVKNLRQYIETGRTFDKHIIVNNFIDALTLSRLRYDFEINNSRVITTIKKTLTKIILENRTREVFSSINLAELKKNKNMWEKGLLKPFYKRKMLNDIIIEIIWEMIHKNPIDFLYLERPQDIKSIVEKELFIILKEKYSQPLELYKEQLGILVPKKIKVELSKIRLEDSHRVPTILQNKFLMEATLKIVEKDPLFIVLTIDEEKILSIFYDIIEPYLKPGFPQILKEAIKLIAPKQKGELIGDFIEKWLINLSQISLDSTTIEMLRQILEEGVSLDELKEKGKPLIPDEFPKWFKSWDKIFEKKSRKKSVQFTPFQGVLIVDSSIKTLSGTIDKGMRELLASKDPTKNYFLSLMKIYNTIIPIIAIGFATKTVDRVIRKNELSPFDFYPRISSLLLVWARNEKYQLFVDDKAVKWTKPNFKKGLPVIEVEDNKIHPSFLINTFVSLLVKLPDDTLLHLKNKTFDPELFLEVYSEEKVPLQAIAFTATTTFIERSNSGIITWLAHHSPTLMELIGYLEAALESTKSNNMFNSFKNSILKTLDYFEHNAEIQIVMGDNYTSFKETCQNIRQKLENYSHYNWKKRSKKFKEFKAIVNDIRNTLPAMIEYAYVDYLKQLSVDFEELGSKIKTSIMEFKDIINNSNSKIKRIIKNSEEISAKLSNSFNKLLSSGFRPTDWQIEGKPGMFIHSQYSKMEEALNDLISLFKTSEKEIIVQDMPLTFFEGKPVIEICNLKIKPDDEKILEEIFPFKIKHSRRGATIDIYLELSEFYPVELFDDNYLTLSKAITILTWKDKSDPLTCIYKIGQKITEIFGGSTEFWNYLINSFTVPPE